MIYMRDALDLVDPLVGLSALIGQSLEPCLSTACCPILVDATFVLLLPANVATAAAACRQIQALTASRASRVNLSRPPLYCTVRQGIKKSPSPCTTFRPLRSNECCSLSVMFINHSFWNGRPRGFKSLSISGSPLL